MSRRVLILLSVWMLAGFALALVVLPFARDDWPMWIVPVVLAVSAVSIAGPILVGGWMLGRGLARRGGPVGLLFAAGVVAGPFGQSNDLAPVMWGGYAALVVGAIGLALLGRRAVRRVGRRRGPGPRRGTSAPARRPASRRAGSR